MTIIYTFNSTIDPANKSFEIHLYGNGRYVVDYGAGDNNAFIITEDEAFAMVAAREPFSALLTIFPDLTQGVLEEMANDHQRRAEQQDEWEDEWERMQEDMERDERKVQSRGYVFAL